MNTQELKDKYWSLYEQMANSKDANNMKVFGKVMSTMMEDIISSSPSKAEEYIGRLEAVRWKNYLTPTEANKIVSQMEPEAPWSSEQWRQAIEQSVYPLEEWPCYNSCALYATMNMIMSDSSTTIDKYVKREDIFKMVHDLAVDKLCDKDEVFSIRRYFGV